MIAYEATCAITGKRYIGITRYTVAKRWREHVRAAERGDGPLIALHCAIRKHGSRAFSVREIACARAWNDLLAVERTLIAQEGTFVPSGYNRTLGGEGIIGLPRDAEHNAKIAAAIRAIWAARSAEDRAAIAERGASTLRGRPLTADHRSKVSAALTGRAHSDEHNEAVSKAMRGNPNVGTGRRGAMNSPEHRARVSAAKILGWKRKKEAIAICVEVFGVAPPKNCRTTTISLPEWARRDLERRHEAGEFTPPQERVAA